ncbi:MAG: (p)ppGpp synthetase [Treponema sp.]|jgi:putative GTP pyrophosphokinase|nr:(p)ppGpp synthetase [Treponema sp.]
MDLPDKKKLQDSYIHYAEVRLATAKGIEACLENILSFLSPRPTVKGRIKDFDSYYKKYIKLLKQNTGNAEAPLITDIIGIRVVCPFIVNLDEVQQIIGEHFTVIDIEKKGSNYSYKEFGYESIHLLINIPHDIIEKFTYSGCDVAEIQIRTILQDAWAEVEHELVYKAEFTPFDMNMKRKLASINASLSLADIIFQEIRDYQQQLHAESSKRREDFFNKLEENIDTFLFSDIELASETKAYTVWEQSKNNANMSIDDLLLTALYAHNRKDFNTAIKQYTRILSMRPKNNIISIIYSHRGMANFAQSCYEDAVVDFNKALEYDDKAYKAAYYRGLVRLVQRKWVEAVDDFTLSLAINPYQPFCLYRRGHANYHNGDKIQALSDCEATLLLMPDFEDAMKFKKFILHRMNFV